MSDVIILNFHGIGPEPPGLAPGEHNCWTEASFFQGILDLVRDRADVQITFDDSNVSDYQIARPALMARRMKAKFFAVAARIDQPGYVSSRQLQEMSGAGLTVGSHGMQHRGWAGLNAEDLIEELIEARSRLEKIVGAPVQEAACPFGSYDRRVLGALRRAGYERVYTSDEGPAPAGAWLQPRNTVHRTDDLARINRLINWVPSGLPKLWRGMKLKLKQWR
ncbi:MAG: polysaccharide deacetylase family protein [Verrucomicrobiota bacterium]